MSKRLRSFGEILEAEGRSIAPSGRPLSAADEAVKAAILTKTRAEEAEMTDTETQAKRARLRAAAAHAIADQEVKRAAKAARERERRAMKKALAAAAAIDAMQAQPELDAETASALVDAATAAHDDPAAAIHDATYADEITVTPQETITDAAILDALRAGDLSIPKIAAKYESTYNHVKRLAVANAIPIGRARTGTSSAPKGSVAYRRGVEFVAWNDEDSVEDPEIIKDQLSVVALAAAFEKDVEAVAADVLRVRQTDPEFVERFGGVS